MLGISTWKELWWAPSPKLLSYVGDRVGRGGGGHNFIEVMEQVRDEEPVFCLWPYFQGAFQPVLGPMGIISCTATKLYKKQLWGD